MLIWPAFSGTVLSGTGCTAGTKIEVRSVERFSEEMAGVSKFALRVARFQLLAGAMLLAGLAPGIIGFFLLEQLETHEALLNCLSMLGAVNMPYPPGTVVGLYFTALYGLFLDSVFLVSVGIVLAPFVHRALHRCNLETD